MKISQNGADNLLEHGLTIKICEISTGYYQSPAQSVYQITRRLPC